MADPLSLDHEAEGLKFGEALRLDELSANLKLREQQLRESVAGEIFAIFKRANTITFALVAVLAIVDIACVVVWPIAGYNRLITSEVLMTLIGATVVQAGATAFAIAVSLFPKTRSE